jgi:transmembrane sensor
MNKQIIDEAAAWFVEVNEDELDPATRRKFHAWLCQSPEHVRAYLKIVPIWEAGADLAPFANGDPDALIAWAAADNNVVTFDAGAADRRHGSDAETTLTRTRDSNASRPGDGVSWQRRSLRAMAASVALVCIALAASAWWMWDARSTYETAIGEQRVIALADGSTVKLNSRSRIKVRLGKQRRSIQLLEGQAFFQVAKDEARPFVVLSGDTAVRAVGTQFDVYRKTADTVVTVVEGRVAVTPASLETSAGRAAADTRHVTPSQIPLSAGEQLVVSANAESRPRPADVDIATAWTQQLLVFSNTPLVEVAQEFNRYNKRQLVIAPGALADFNVTGTFSSTNPLGLTRFLQAQPGVQVIETQTRILVSSR